VPGEALTHHLADDLAERRSRSEYSAAASRHLESQVASVSRFTSRSLDQRVNNESRLRWCREISQPGAIDRWRRIRSPGT